MHVIFLNRRFSGYTPRSGIAGSCGNGSVFRRVPLLPPSPSRFLPSSGHSSGPASWHTCRQVALPVALQFSTCDLLHWGREFQRQTLGAEASHSIHCGLSMGLKCFIIPSGFLVSGPLAFWWEDPSFPQPWALRAAVLGLLASPVLVQAKEVEAFPCDSLGSWSSLLRSSAGGPWRRTRILFSLPDAPRARAQHLPCRSLLSPVLQISAFLPASLWLPHSCPPSLLGSSRLCPVTSASLEA